MEKATTSTAKTRPIIPIELRTLRHRRCDVCGKPAQGLTRTKGRPIRYTCRLHNRQHGVLVGPLAIRRRRLRLAERAL